jgi:ornithine racemase
MYPRVVIDLNKLKHNTKQLVKLCHNAQIETIFGVTKVLAGDGRAIEAMIEGGITHLADSRIQNLRMMRHYPLPKVLLRLPMLSEVSEVVQYADCSLNSELEVIEALNEKAGIWNKVHDIILMIDLGDLREGIWFEDDLIYIVESILRLKHIQLKGIGTNLTCYGGVIPNQENLNQLLAIKTQIEEHFKIRLEVISGGNTSSLHLIYKQCLPKGINNLRLGEGILFGRETAYEKDLEDLYQDVCLLQAEIIELKTKPSIPIGEIGVDAFGFKPEFNDEGVIKRAIIAIGRQDVYPNNITPLDSNVKILGASSDHLIVDVTKGDVKLGDIVSFKLNYGGLLQVMTSAYVEKSHL